MDDVPGFSLPTSYGPWTLQTNTVAFNDEGTVTDGFIEYEARITDDVAFTVYIEAENDGTWGGALIDSSTPENPHRDAIDTFHGDDIETILTHAKSYMDRNVDEYIP